MEIIINGIKYVPLDEQAEQQDKKDDEWSNQPFCKYCNLPIAFRNPSGNCDHLYYPNNVNKDFKKPSHSSKPVKECEHNWGIKSAVTSTKTPECFVEYICFKCQETMMVKPYSPSESVKEIEPLMIYTYLKYNDRTGVQEVLWRGNYDKFGHPRVLSVEELKSLISEHLLGGKDIYTLAEAIHEALKRKEK